MHECCEHIIVNARQPDPTRTIVLRNAFATDMRKRFRELSRVINTTVNKNDAFGLRTFQMTPAQPGAFAFPKSSDKIESFNIWLQNQIDRGILEVGTVEGAVGVEKSWTNKYILDSYRRGVLRARYELQRAGFDVPSIEATGGIDISLSTPFHLDRLELLYTRTFNELKGITDAMDQQISRVLAQGIADGDNPKLLARKLTSTINGTKAGELGLTDTLGRFIPAERRAVIIARTEVIRAHHQATIQEYRNWGVEGVVIKVEWVTAGDDRVCERCQALEGQVFTLDEIEGKIPLHPQCRCVALPFKVDS